MIDFYKFNFLSNLGKDAGEMNETEYQKKIVQSYGDYLLKLRKIKRDKELEGE